MKSKVSLRIVLVLAMLVAGVLFYQAQAGDKAPAAAPAAPPPPKVTIASVEQRTVVNHRELLGRVEARESVEVRPRVSGHIESVKLQAGQTVRKGDVLFVIDPRWYKAASDLATANVKSAEVRVGIKQRDARRADDLLKSRAISQEESETRQAELAEAEAALEAAKAQLDGARLDLEHTQVRSPIDGIVSRALVTEGNLVSGASMLASIVSTGDMHVYADVDEATLLTFNRLSRESRLPLQDGRVVVEMQLADEDGFQHRGYIESADNRLDAGTGSLVLRLVFANPDGKLLPGLAARVRLPVSAAEPSLLVSERSIGTNQSQKYVYVVAADNTVAQRSIELGPMIDGKRIIRGGIQPGERVIVNGMQRVSAGITVEPQSADSVAVTQASNL